MADFDMDGKTQPLNPRRVGMSLSQWYQLWRVRFSMWLAKDLDPQFEDILHQMPNLVQLVIELLQDPDLPSSAREPLSAAAEYIINPQDLLPEEQHGILGLLDDALVVIRPLLSLDAALLHAHWAGQRDPLELLAQIESQHDAILHYVNQKRAED